MNELLKKIYEQVISNEEETIKAGKRVDEWINKLTENYTNQLNSNDMEILKDLMYSVALKAQQEGFQLGMQFTIKIMQELFADS